MRTVASILKYPIHPMLIAFPIGLWVFSLICDIIYRTPFGGTREWLIVALYTLIGGIVGAVIAAIPGRVDYLAVRDKSLRIKKMGATHRGFNLTVTFFYVINALWRIKVDPASNTSFLLSILAIMLLATSGWLGGEMIYTDPVAVEPWDEKEEEPKTRKAA